MRKSDLTIVEQIKNGDTAAFAELVQRYEKKVFNIAYRLLGNKDDASDLAQEAFLRVYRSLSGFRGEAAFSTWLYRIVTNTCFDELRRRRKQVIASLDEPLAGEGGEYLRQVVDSTALPETALEQQELQQRIQQAISRLTADHRVVIVLRDLQGFSYQEIAEILHCSVGTVKSRLNRGRLRLRLELLNHSPDLIYSYYQKQERQRLNVLWN